MPGREVWTAAHLHVSSAARATRNDRRNPLATRNDRRSPLLTCRPLLGQEPAKHSAWDSSKWVIHKCGAQPCNCPPGAPQARRPH